MSKRVNQMTKEEIALMFPIELKHYDDHWPELFNEEKSLITKTVGNDIILRIEHFGSTSIPGILAKDTIDMLVEVPADANIQEAMTAKMSMIYYDFMWQTDGKAPYMVFVKGYDTSGQKRQTYHVHAAPIQHELWNRLLFRDYLREKKHLAVEYANLKLALAQHFRHDRVGYRIAKTEFIANITAEAKQYYTVRDPLASS